MPVYVKVGGVWKEAEPYVKIDGAWKSVSPYVKVGGAWKDVQVGPENEFRFQSITQVSGEFVWYLDSIIDNDMNSVAHLYPEFDEPEDRTYGEALVEFDFGEVRTIDRFIAKFGVIDPYNSEASAWMTDLEYSVDGSSWQSSPGVAQAEGDPVVRTVTIGGAKMARYWRMSFHVGTLGLVPSISMNIYDVRGRLGA